MIRYLQHTIRGSFTKVSQLLKNLLLVKTMCKLFFVFVYSPVDYFLYNSTGVCTFMLLKPHLRRKCYKQCPLNYMPWHLPSKFSLISAWTNKVTLKALLPCWHLAPVWPGGHWHPPVTGSHCPEPQERCWT